jgi:hypothetical protein
VRDVVDQLDLGPFLRAYRADGHDHPIHQQQERGQWRSSALHPGVPQPDGTVLYELLTGHPDRTPYELVFVADLTVELRAWPTDTWAKVGVDPEAAFSAVIAPWRGDQLKGPQLGGLTGEEAIALERPAMTYVREQLRQRLGQQVQQAWWRWLHPTSGRRPADRFL